MPTNLYALIEARPGHSNLGLPFYIGIGTAKRPYVHLALSRTPKGHRNIRLHEILVSHRDLGVHPGVEFLGRFASKQEAGKAETEAIAYWGRVGIEEGGILCNLAKGGQGPDAELMRLPEMRKRNSEIQKNASPELKAKRMAFLEASRHDPEARSKRSAKTAARNKDVWADPELRAKRIAAMKGKKKTMTAEGIAARQANLAKAHSEEGRDAHAKAMQETWQRPEFIESHRTAQTAAWQDPEKRANMLANRSQGIASSWSDPEVRAKRIAGIKAAAARKKTDGDC